MAGNGGPVVMRPAILRMGERGPELLSPHTLLHPLRDLPDHVVQDIRESFGRLRIGGPSDSICVYREGVGGAGDASQELRGLGVSQVQQIPGEVLLQDPLQDAGSQGETCDLGLQGRDAAIDHFGQGLSPGCGDHGEETESAGPSMGGPAGEVRS